ncbi:hypothetical protein CVIRNUC_002249 [Coccomyxa viridis]|uniref:DUF1990 domain-containing protein n=1 Tax=Coccomyxa viridis TaxID=1274662 RepID=A0AAV1HX50_9CHLO|nr:hypothetical protein CVIRNUC_002249 [Coccomyxa viridis]
MRLGFAGISSRKPDHSVIDRDVQRSKSASPNHRHAGSTESIGNDPPLLQQRGWHIDYDCVQVGSGKQAYSNAKEAVKQWKHMDLGWVATNRPVIEVGQATIVMARVLGLLWMRNPLRIVYQGEQKAPVPACAVRAGRRQSKSCKKGLRFDLGQTTLEGHSLAGEERFSVQWCKEDDSVWYEIYAVSRPATLLAIASYPLTRHYQRRFRRESLSAVQAAAGEY